MSTSRREPGRFHRAGQEVAEAEEEERGNYYSIYNFKIIYSYYCFIVACRYLKICSDCFNIVCQFPIIVVGRFVFTFIQFHIDIDASWEVAVHPAEDGRQPETHRERAARAPEGHPEEALYPHERQVQGEEVAPVCVGTRQLCDDGVRVQSDGGQSKIGMWELRPLRLFRWI